MGMGLNSLQYGVLYLGSHYNTGSYISFPHCGNSNLGKLPYGLALVLRTSEGEPHYNLAMTNAGPTPQDVSKEDGPNL